MSPQGRAQPSAEGAVEAAEVAAVAEGAEAGAVGALVGAVEGAEGGVADPQRPQVSSNRLTEEATIERAAVEETPAEGEAIEETADEDETAAEGGAAAAEVQTVQWNCAMAKYDTSDRDDLRQFHESSKKQRAEWRDREQQVRFQMYEDLLD